MLIGVHVDASYVVGICCPGGLTGGSAPDVDGNDGRECASVNDIVVGDGSADVVVAGVTGGDVVASAGAADVVVLEFCSCCPPLCRFLCIP